MRPRLILFVALLCMVTTSANAETRELLAPYDHSFAIEDYLGPRMGPGGPHGTTAAADVSGKLRASARLQAGPFDSTHIIGMGSYTFAWSGVCSAIDVPDGTTSLELVAHIHLDRADATNDLELAGQSVGPQSWITPYIDINISNASLSVGTPIVQSYGPLSRHVVGADLDVSGAVDSNATAGEVLQGPGEVCAGIDVAAVTGNGPGGASAAAVAHVTGLSVTAH